MDQLEFYKAKLQFETDSWDLSESLNNGDNVVVIDARSPEAYGIEHIPTAINIPHRIMSPESTKHFDREKLYITYCDGIGCNASTKGALKMAEFGFRVKELLGGIDWWRRDGYETHGTQARAGNKIACGC
ncbi:rhodanese-like domain-containing protein [Nitrosomonas ureae]|uniref:Rhodanese-related sulfurtransferase n=1 Tax=Nitrosomonas ureae TaxID=44577 RepID=A0A2T5IM20_9PROT|nr:rhodanese-like domain-containing protein [Nitrosomonas ureae]PTQ84866.1 rhodanese-related sulfurtransferase [Nitrosomonas ureae]